VFVPENWLRPAREDAFQSDPPLIREDFRAIIREDREPARAEDREGIREDGREDLRRLAAGWEHALVLARIRAEAAETRVEKADTERRTVEARAEQAEADRRNAEARTERAEAAIADERQRAEALRDRLATAERDLAVARHDAKAVQQAAAEFRLAETERKGRGRWARLRAAWRGE
jgi:plectin